MSARAGSPRRRELRVRLRSDRVGHAAVIDWLDAMERDGRGVAGLQARVIEVLSEYLASQTVGPPVIRPSRPPQEGASMGDSVARPHKGTPPRAVVAITAGTHSVDDVLTRATNNLNF